ncbi:ATP-binding cassette domain-containing protein [Ignavigranum ruoffiae]|uniref:ATP-binding cassette domain-containing protein n=1 Tax=Ignavigranum ruoffiae TaxID=89093 RepID=UPI0024AD533A|nr:ABC transporter ATP-binding protein [Ignavigranum ruoffiae]
MKLIKKIPKKLLFMVVLSAFILALSRVLLPLLVPNSPLLNLSRQTILVIFVAMMLVSFLLQSLLTIIRERWTQEMNANHFEDNLRYLFQLEYDQIVEQGATAIIQRFFEVVDALYLFVMGGLNSLLTASILIGLTLAVALWLDFKIFLSLLLLLPINYFGFCYINRSLSQRMRNFQEKFASTQQNIIQIVANVDYLKSLASYNTIHRLIAEDILEAYGRLAKTNRFANISSNLISSLNQCVQYSIYLLMILSVAKAETSIASLLTTSIVLPIYFQAMGDLTRANLDMSSLRTAEDYLMEHILPYREAVDHGAEIEQIDSIQMNEVIYQLGQERKIVINQRFAGGDWIKVAGPSGSGKSSLMKVLLKFRPSSGIYINGSPLNQVSNLNLRGRIAYLTQEPPIFNKTLAENIGNGRDLNQEEKAFLEETEILSTIFEHKDWQSYIQQGGSNLSGGEKQRIAIARLLLQNPDVIILDEITSAVDEESAEKIFQLLKEYFGDKIVFVISHDPSKDKYCNRRIVL